MNAVRLKNSLVLLALFSAFFIMAFYDEYREMYSSAGRLTAASEGQSTFNANLKLVQKIKLKSQADYLGYLQQRDFADASTLDGRQRLRWLYKTLEINAYLAIAELGGERGPRLASYAGYALSAFWSVLAVLFSYLFAAKLLNWSGGRNLGGFSLAGLAFLAFLFSTPRIADPFSIVEMAAISICLYASFRRSFWLFLFGLILGVANRETGAALGAIYAIINWPDRRAWLALPLGPIILLGLNLDLIVQPEFFDPETFFVSSKFVYANVFNLHNIPFTNAAFSIFKALLPLVPLAFVLKRIWVDPIGRRVAIVIGLYVFIILFGTYLGNLFTYLLIVPQTLILMGIAYQRHMETEFPQGAHATE